MPPFPEGQGCAERTAPKKPRAVERASLELRKEARFVALAAEVAEMNRISVMKAKHNSYKERRAAREAASAPTNTEMAVPVIIVSAPEEESTTPVVVVASQSEENMMPAAGPVRVNARLPPRVSEYIAEDNVVGFWDSLMDPEAFKFTENTESEELVSNRQETRTEAPRKTIEELLESYDQEEFDFQKSTEVVESEESELNSQEERTEVLRKITKAFFDSVEDNNFDFTKSITITRSEETVSNCQEKRTEVISAEVQELLDAYKKIDPENVPSVRWNESLGVMVEHIPETNSRQSGANAFNRALGMVVPFTPAPRVVVNKGPVNNTEDTVKETVELKFKEPVKHNCLTSNRDNIASTSTKMVEHVLLSDAHFKKGTIDAKDLKQVDLWLHMVKAEAKLGPQYLTTRPGQLGRRKELLVAEYPYRYSGRTTRPCVFTIPPTIQAILQKYCPTKPGEEYNAMLSVYYPDGTKGLRHHRDDEQEHQNDVVFTISMGSNATLELKDESGYVHSHEVRHGEWYSLKHQADFTHAVETHGPRTALTFRRFWPKEHWNEIELPEEKVAEPLPPQVFNAKSLRTLAISVVALATKTTNDTIKHAVMTGMEKRRAAIRRAEFAAKVQPKKVGEPQPLPYKPLQLQRAKGALNAEGLTIAQRLAMIKLVTPIPKPAVVRPAPPAVEPEGPVETWNPDWLNARYGEEIIKNTPQVKWGNQTKYGADIGKRILIADQADVKRCRAKLIPIAKRMVISKSPTFKKWWKTLVKRSLPEPETSYYRELVVDNPESPIIQKLEAPLETWAHWWTSHIIQTAEKQVKKSAEAFEKRKEKREKKAEKQKLKDAKNKARLEKRQKVKEWRDEITDSYIDKQLMCDEEAADAYFAQLIPMIRQSQQTLKWDIRRYHFGSKKEMWEARQEKRLRKAVRTAVRYFKHLQKMERNQKRLLAMAAGSVDATAKQAVLHQKRIRTNVCKKFFDKFTHKRINLDLADNRAEVSEKLAQEIESFFTKSELFCSKKQEIEQIIDKSELVSSKKNFFETLQRAIDEQTSHEEPPPADPVIEEDDYNNLEDLVQDEVIKKEKYKPRRRIGKKHLTRRQKKSRADLLETKQNIKFIKNGYKFNFKKPFFLLMAILLAIISITPGAHAYQHRQKRERTVPELGYGITPSLQQHIHHMVPITSLESMCQKIDEESTRRYLCAKTYVGDHNCNMDQSAFKISGRMLLGDHKNCFVPFVTDTLETTLPTMLTFSFENDIESITGSKQKYFSKQHCNIYRMGKLNNPMFQLMKTSQPHDLFCDLKSKQKQVDEILSTSVKHCVGVRFNSYEDKVAEVDCVIHDSALVIEFGSTNVQNQELVVAEEQVTFNSLQLQPSVVVKHLNIDQTTHSHRHAHTIQNCVKATPTVMVVHHTEYEDHFVTITETQTVTRTENIQPTVIAQIQQQLCTVRQSQLEQQEDKNNHDSLISDEDFEWLMKLESDNEKTHEKDLLGSFFADAHTLMFYNTKPENLEYILSEPDHHTEYICDIQNADLLPPFYANRWETHRCWNDFVQTNFGFIRQQCARCFSMMQMCRVKTKLHEVGRHMIQEAVIMCQDNIEGTTTQADQPTITWSPTTWLNPIEETVESLFSSVRDVFKTKAVRVMILAFIGYIIFINTKSILITVFIVFVTWAAIMPTAKAADLTETYMTKDMPYILNVDFKNPRYHEMKDKFSDRVNFVEISFNQAVGLCSACMSDGHAMTLQYDKLTVDRDCQYPHLLNYLAHHELMPELKKGVCIYFNPWEACDEIGKGHALAFQAELLQKCGDWDPKTRHNDAYWMAKEKPNSYTPSVFPTGRPQTLVTTTKDATTITTTTTTPRSHVRGPHIAVEEPVTHHHYHNIPTPPPVKPTQKPSRYGSIVTSTNQVAIPLENVIDNTAENLATQAKQTITDIWRSFVNRWSDFDAEEIVKTSNKKVTDSVKILTHSGKSFTTLIIMAAIGFYWVGPMGAFMFGMFGYLSSAQLAAALPTTIDYALAIAVFYCGLKFGKSLMLALLMFLIVVYVRPVSGTELNCQSTLSTTLAGTKTRVGGKLISVTDGYYTATQKSCIYWNAYKNIGTNTKPNYAQVKRAISIDEISLAVTPELRYLIAQKFGVEFCFAYKCPGWYSYDINCTDWDARLRLQQNIFFADWVANEEYESRYSNTPCFATGWYSLRKAMWIDESQECWMYSLTKGSTVRIALSYYDDVTMPATVVKTIFFQDSTTPTQIVSGVSIMMTGHTHSNIPAYIVQCQQHGLYAYNDQFTLPLNVMYRQHEKAYDQKVILDSITCSPAQTYYNQVKCWTFMKPFLSAIPSNVLMPLQETNITNWVYKNHQEIINADLHLRIEGQVVENDFCIIKSISMKTKFTPSIDWTHHALMNFEIVNPPCTLNVGMVVSDICTVAAFHQGIVSKITEVGITARCTDHGETLLKFTKNVTVKATVESSGLWGYKHINNEIDGSKSYTGSTMFQNLWSNGGGINPFSWLGSATSIFSSSFMTYLMIFVILMAFNKFFAIAFIIFVAASLNGAQACETTSQDVFVKYMDKKYDFIIPGLVGFCNIFISYTNAIYEVINSSVSPITTSNYYIGQAWTTMLILIFTTLLAIRLLGCAASSFVVTTVFYILYPTEYWFIIPAFVSTSDVLYNIYEGFKNTSLVKSRFFVNFGQTVRIIGDVRLPITICMVLEFFVNRHLTCTMIMGVLFIIIHEGRVVTCGSSFIATLHVFFDDWRPDIADVVTNNPQMLNFYDESTTPAILKLEKCIQVDDSDFCEIHYGKSSTYLGKTFVAESIQFNGYNYCGYRLAIWSNIKDWVELITGIEYDIAQDYLYGRYHHSLRMVVYNEYHGDETPVIVSPFVGDEPRLMKAKDLQDIYTDFQFGDIDVNTFWEFLKYVSEFGPNHPTGKLVTVPFYGVQSYNRVEQVVTFYLLLLAKFVLPWLGFYEPAWWVDFLFNFAGIVNCIELDKIYKNEIQQLRAKSAFKIVQACRGIPNPISHIRQNYAGETEEIAQQVEASLLLVQGNNIQLNTKTELATPKENEEIKDYFIAQEQANKKTNKDKDPHIKDEYIKPFPLSHPRMLIDKIEMFELGSMDNQCLCPPLTGKWKKGIAIGEGDCFYSSIAALSGFPNKRSHILTFKKTIADTIEKSLRDNDPKKADQFKEHLKTIRQPGNFATCDDMDLISRHFDVRFCIHHIELITFSNENKPLHYKSMEDYYEQNPRGLISSRAFDNSDPKEPKQLFNKNGKPLYVHPVYGINVEQCLQLSFYHIGAKNASITYHLILRAQHFEPLIPDDMWIEETMVVKQKRQREVDDNNELETALANCVSNAGSIPVACAVQYNWLEWLSCLIGYSNMFVKNLSFPQENRPTIYSVSTMNKSGFAFAWNGTVYSSYHVTEGRPLVIPVYRPDTALIKEWYQPSLTNIESDVVTYGGQPNLLAPSIGHYYFVANPRTQQIMLFKLCYIDSQAGDNMYNFERIIQYERTNDDGSKSLIVSSTNIYSRFGWSGLPMIDVVTGLPVGVYGNLARAFNTDNVYVRSAAQLIEKTPVNFEKIVREINDSPKEMVFNVYTPTASGKSTLLPLACAKFLMSTKKHGLVILCNPLRVVPITLAEYMKRRISNLKLDNYIQVEYSIGEGGQVQLSSIKQIAKTKVLVLYISYGKYIQWMRDMSADYLLLDEVHYSHATVKFITSFFEWRQHNQHQCGSYVGPIEHVAQLTATPIGDNKVVDRPITRMEAKYPGANKKFGRQYVQVYHNLMFDTSTVTPDRKHLIFVPSHNAVNKAVKALKDRIKNNVPIYGFYSGIKDAANIIFNINTCLGGILVTTNAIESGMTINGVTDVWDTGVEVVSELSEGELADVQVRPIDRRAQTQRMGRAGRTTSQAYYWISPLAENSIVAENSLTEEVKFSVALYYLYKKIDECHIPPPFDAYAKQLTEEYAQCPPSWVDSLIWADVDPHTFFHLSDVATIRGQRKRAWHPDVFSEAFSKANAGQKYTSQAKDSFIVSYEAKIPPAWLKRRERQNEEISYLEQQKNSGHSLWIGLGFVSTVGVVLTMLTSLISDRMSACKVDELWITVTPNNFSDLSFGCSFDFVKGYQEDLFENNRLSTIDPHELMDNKFVRFFNSGRNATIRHLPRGVTAVWSKDTKRVIAFVTTITAAGNLVIDYPKFDVDTALTPCIIMIGSLSATQLFSLAKKITAGYRSSISIDDNDFIKEMNYKQKANLKPIKAESQITEIGKVCGDNFQKAVDKLKEKWHNTIYRPQNASPSSGDRTSVNEDSQFEKKEPPKKQLSGYEQNLEFLAKKKGTVKGLVLPKIDNMPQLEKEIQEEFKLQDKLAKEQLKSKILKDSVVSAANSNKSFTAVLDNSEKTKYDWIVDMCGKDDKVFIDSMCKADPKFKLYLQFMDECDTGISVSMRSSTTVKSDEAEPNQETGEDALAIKDSDQHNSLEAECGAAWQILLKTVAKQSPTIALMLAKTGAMGTLCVGGISVTWDRLVANLGPMGAVFVGAMFVNLLCNPTMIVADVMGGTLIYVLKVITMGTTVGPDGRLLKATPFALAGSLALGHVLKGIEVARVTHHESPAMAVGAAITSVDLARVPTGTPSAVVAIKQLYTLFRSIVTIFKGEELSHRVCTTIISTLAHVIYLLATMNPMTSLLTVTVAVCLTLLYAACNANKTIKKNLLAQIIKNDKIYDSFKDEWEQNFEQILYWVLNIASVVVYPSSIFSVATMTVWYLVHTALNKKNLDKEDFADCLTAGFACGSGLPLMLSLGYVITLMGPVMLATNADNVINSIQVNSGDKTSGIIDYLAKLFSWDSLEKIISFVKSLPNLMWELLCKFVPRKIPEDGKEEECNPEINVKSEIWNRVVKVAQYCKERVLDIGTWLMTFFKNLWATLTKPKTRTWFESLVTDSNLWTIDFPLPSSRLSRFITFVVNPYLHPVHTTGYDKVIDCIMDRKNNTSIIRFKEEIKNMNKIYLGRSRLALFEVKECKKFDFQGLLSFIKEFVQSEHNIMEPIDNDMQWCVPDLMSYGGLWVDQRGLNVAIYHPVENSPAGAYVTFFSGYVSVFLLGSPFLDKYKSIMFDKVKKLIEHVTGGMVTLVKDDYDAHTTFQHISSSSLWEHHSRKAEQILMQQFKMRDEKTPNEQLFGVVDFFQSLWNPNKDGYIITDESKQAMMKRHKQVENDIAENNIKDIKECKGGVFFDPLEIENWEIMVNSCDEVYNSACPKIIDRFRPHDVFIGAINGAEHSHRPILKALYGVDRLFDIKITHTETGKMKKNHMYETHWDQNLKFDFDHYCDQHYNKIYGPKLVEPNNIIVKPVIVKFDVNNTIPEPPQYLDYMLGCFQAGKYNITANYPTLCNNFIPTDVSMLTIADAYGVAGIIRITPDHICRLKLEPPKAFLVGAYCTVVHLIINNTHHQILCHPLDFVSWLIYGKNLHYSVFNPAHYVRMELRDKKKMMDLFVRHYIPIVQSSSIVTKYTPYELFCSKYADYYFNSYLYAHLSFGPWHFCSCKTCEECRTTIERLGIELLSCPPVYPNIKGGGFVSDLTNKMARTAHEHAEKQVKSIVAIQNALEKKVKNLGDESDDDEVAEINEAVNGIMDSVAVMCKNNHMQKLYSEAIFDRTVKNFSSVTVRLDHPTTAPVTEMMKVIIQVKASLLLSHSMVMCEHSDYWMDGKMENQTDTFEYESIAFLLKHMNICSDEKKTRNEGLYSLLGSGWLSGMIVNDFFDENCHNFIRTYSHGTDLGWRHCLRALTRLQLVIGRKDRAYNLGIFIPTMYAITLAVPLLITDEYNILKRLQIHEHTPNHTNFYVYTRMHFDKCKGNDVNAFKATEKTRDLEVLRATIDALHAVNKNNNQQYYKDGGTLFFEQKNMENAVKYAAEAIQTYTVEAEEWEEELNLLRKKERVENPIAHMVSRSNSPSIPQALEPNPYSYTTAVPEDVTQQVTENAISLLRETSLTCVNSDTRKYIPGQHVEITTPLPVNRGLFFYNPMTPLQTILGPAPWSSMGSVLSSIGMFTKYYPTPSIEIGEMVQTSKIICASTRQIVREKQEIVTQINTLLENNESIEQDEFVDAHTGNISEPVKKTEDKEKEQDMGEHQQQNTKTGGMLQTFSNAVNNFIDGWNHPGPSTIGVISEQREREIHAAIEEVLPQRNRIFEDAFEKQLTVQTKIKGCNSIIFDRTPPHLISLNGVNPNIFQHYSVDSNDVRDAMEREYSHFKRMRKQNQVEIPGTPDIYKLMGLQTHIQRMTHQLGAELDDHRKRKNLNVSQKSTLRWRRAGVYEYGRVPGVTYTGYYELADVDKICNIYRSYRLDEEGRMVGDVLTTPTLCNKRILDYTPGIGGSTTYIGSSTLKSFITYYQDPSDEFPTQEIYFDTSNHMNHVSNYKQLLQRSGIPNPVEDPTKAVLQIGGFENKEIGYQIIHNDSSDYSFNVCKARKFDSEHRYLESIIKTLPLLNTATRHSINLIERGIDTTNQANGGVYIFSISNPSSLIAALTCSIFNNVKFVQPPCTKLGSIRCFAICTGGFHRNSQSIYQRLQDIYQHFERCSGKDTSIKIGNNKTNPGWHKMSPTELDRYLHEYLLCYCDITTYTNLSLFLTNIYCQEFARQLKWLQNTKKQHWRPIGVLSYPTLNKGDLEMGKWYATTILQQAKRSGDELLDLVSKSVQCQNKFGLNCPQHAYICDTDERIMYNPYTDKPGEVNGVLHDVGLKTRLPHNLPSICVKNKIRLEHPENVTIFFNQKILGTYRKQDRLTTDKTLMCHTISQLTRNVIGFHPTNSPVTQVSKDRLQVLKSIQERVDRPPVWLEDDVFRDLQKLLPFLHTDGAQGKNIPENEKLKPWTFEEAKTAINKQGAAGLFDHWGKMQQCIDDPETPTIVNRWMGCLTSGETCPYYYVTVHNKVEAKVSKRAEDGMLIDCDPEHLHPKPRLISYYSCIARILDWMIFGPYVYRHYNIKKNFKYTSSGTPLSEMGDKLFASFNRYNDKPLKNLQMSAITGRVSSNDLYDYFHNQVTCSPELNKLTADIEGKKLKLFKRKDQLYGSDGFYHNRMKFNSNSYTARAITGDASKWDHSLGPRYMILEAIFICQHYQQQYHDLILTIFEHTIWSPCFTRLGFVYTAPGHRYSGHILTWHNSFGNGLYHLYAKIRALHLPISPSHIQYEKVKDLANKLKQRGVLGSNVVDNVYDYDQISKELFATPTNLDLLAGNVNNQFPSLFNVQQREYIPFNGGYANYLRDLVDFVDRLVDTFCDGDDNVHFLHRGLLDEYPTFNTDLAFYMEKCGIVIRSGPHSGYRVHDRFDTVDFLSHRYTPVPMLANSKMLEIAFQQLQNHNVNGVQLTDTSFKDNNTASLKPYAVFTKPLDINYPSGLGSNGRFAASVYKKWPILNIRLHGAQPRVQLPGGAISGPHNYEGTRHYVFSRVHYYKMLPWRPISEILGKLSFTMKISCTRNTLKQASALKQKADHKLEHQPSLSYKDTNIMSKILKPLLEAEWHDEVRDVEEDVNIPYLESNLKHWVDQDQSMVIKKTHSGVVGGTGDKGVLVDEGIAFEASKAASYLFLYPHITIVRIICLSVLACLGFPGDSKFFNTWRMIHKIGKLNFGTGESVTDELTPFRNLDQQGNQFTSVQGALRSLYGDGILTFDDIGLMNVEQYNESLSQHINNIRYAFAGGYQKQNEFFIRTVDYLLRDRLNQAKFFNTNNLCNRSVRAVLLMEKKYGYDNVPYSSYFALWRPLSEAASKHIQISKDLDYGGARQALLRTNTLYDPFSWFDDYGTFSSFSWLNEWKSYARNPEIESLPIATNLQHTPQQFTQEHTHKDYGRVDIKDMFSWLYTHPKTTITKADGFAETQQNSALSLTVRTVVDGTHTRSWKPKKEKQQDQLLQEPLKGSIRNLKVLIKQEFITPFRQLTYLLAFIAFIPIILVSKLITCKEPIAKVYTYKAKRKLNYSTKILQTLCTYVPNCIKTKTIDIIATTLKDVVT